jgi:flagellar hook-basal body complex protein FliE
MVNFNPSNKAFFQPLITVLPFRARDNVMHRQESVMVSKTRQPGGNMSVIDTSRIEAMVAQLKAAEARLQGGINPLNRAGQTAEKADFASALKTSLDQVNNVQTKADQLGQRFVAGDDSVNLSDVMISMQKANISFQATVQVRNKLVAAYQDIMNMAV